MSRLSSAVRFSIRLLVLAISAFIGLSLLLALAVMTPPVQKHVKFLVGHALSRQLACIVTIGGIRTNIVNRIDLENVVMCDTAVRGDSVRLGRVRIVYSLPQLINRKVVIRKATVDRAFIRGFRTRNGSLHFPFLPPSRETGENGSPSPWSFSIGVVEFTHLDARYVDSSLSIDAALDGIEGRVRFYRLDSPCVHLRTGAGHAYTPWWRGAINKIEATGLITGSALVLDTAHIEGDSLRVSGKGTIAFRKNEPWDLDAEVFSSRKTLVLLDSIKAVGRGGSLMASVKWHGPIERPAVSLTAAAAGVTLKRLFLDTLRVEADYDTLGEISGVVRIVSPFGTGNATIGGRIPDLLRRPDPKRYAVRARFENVAITELLRHFGVKRRIPEAQATLILETHGRPFTTMPDSLSLKAVINDTADTREGSGTTASVTLHNGVWNARLSDHARNVVQAQGSMGRKDAVSGLFSFTLINPAGITRYLLTEPTSGTLRGSGNLSGNIRRPEISAIITGEKLAWNGIMVDEIHGSVRYAGNQLLIDSVELKTSGELGASLSRFGVKDVSGNFAVTAAGSGPLLHPDLKTHFIIRDLNARGFRAPVVEATGAFRNDTISWSNLRISSDSASIVSSGTAKLSAPDRFISTSIATARRGFRNGTVTAFVTLAGDTLAGNASVASFSSALVGPWVDAQIPFAGELSLKTDLGGVLRNPKVAVSFDFSQAFAQNRKADFLGEMTLRDSTIQGNIRAFTGDVRQPLTISVAIPVSLRKQWTMKNGVRDGAHIKAQGTDVKVRELLSMFMPSLKADGAITLEAEAVKHSGTWRLSGNGAARITAISDSSHGVAIDTLHAEATFNGSEKVSSATIVFTGSGASWQGRRSDMLNGTCRYENDTVFLDTFKSSIGSGSLFATGVVPRTAFDTVKRGNGILFRFLGSGIPIASLGPFGAGVVPQGGTVSADGTIEIRQGKPAVWGRMSLHKARVQLPECAPSLGPIDADIALEGDSAAVTSLRGKIGDAGSFQGSGFARLVKPHHARFVLSARDLRMRCGNLDAGVQQASIRVSDSANVFILSGNIDLAETRYATFFSFNSFVDQRDRPRPARTENNGTLLNRVTLRGTLNLKRNLTIETNIGMVVLDGKAAVVGMLRKPGAIGAIEMTEGYIYYLDRKFTIEKGMFRLQDPDSIAPLVDLTAATQIMAFEVSGQNGDVVEKQYIVTLRINGDLARPNVVLTADPFLRPVQIVSLLTLGTIQGNLGSDITQRIGTILKQQLAGFGTHKLEQWLNIESLDIKLVGKQNAIVTAVKRLSPRLTVSYQTSTDDLTSPRVKASYRLWPFLYVDGTGDYAGRAGADLRLRWSK
jgi:autotransporter translocation and assembly factor TamB